MHTAARLTFAAAVLAGAAIALVATSRSGGGPDEASPGRAGVEPGGAEASPRSSLQAVPLPAFERGDPGSDAEAGSASRPDATGEAASAPPGAAPTMRDVETVRAEVEARFAGADADTLKEAFRAALRDGANEAAQAAIRSHVEGVHAKKLELGDYEVMDDAALERLGIRDVRRSLQPTLFYGQYSLHELPDGRQARTEVEVGDFAGAGVDFDLAIETVWLEKLYADALRQR